MSSDGLSVSDNVTSEEVACSKGTVLLAVGWVNASAVLDSEVGNTSVKSSLPSVNVELVGTVTGVCALATSNS